MDITPVSDGSGFEICSNRCGMTQLMVLCAGLGTRLAALTAECPKPLVPVGDAPLLRHILRQIADAGFGEALINTHYQSSQFDEFACSLGEFTLHRSHESELLGTAGGVKHALHRLHAPLVVWNGDLFLEPPLEKLLRAAEDAAACLLVGPTQGPGTVGIDAAGRVVRLRGERWGQEQRAVDYLGVMSLGPELLTRLPAKGCLIGDLCLPHLRNGGALATLQHTGPWFDVGSLAGYRDANAYWLATRHSDGSSYIAADAVIGPGVNVSRSIVGGGAVLDGAGSLERSIVWTGARVTVPLSDAVVLGSGRVVALGQSPQGQSPQGQSPQGQSPQGTAR